MKYCPCGKTIPQSFIIDGKTYNNKYRKFCYDCSPFKCKKGGGGRLYRNWSEERKARHRAVAAKNSLLRKQKIVDLAGGKCLICGYDKCLRALQFHHRDPKDKLFELNSNSIKSKPWNEIVLEMAKCDLLCVRCHVEIESIPYEHYKDVELIIQTSYPKTNDEDKPINRRQPTFCYNCNKKISSDSVACLHCYHLSKRKVDRPEKEILLKQIKELGFCGTGRFYGVSDNAIRKWLKVY